MHGAAVLATRKKREGPEALSLDHVSPATRLLEKRRQMFEVADELAHRKEWYARQEEAFAHREHALRAKDVELQEQLVKFNKFIAENESKRTRAIKRAADEVNQRRLKQGEVARLEALLQARVAEEEGVRRELALHLRYRAYLQATVDDPELVDFHEVMDLLNRHATLTVANRDLGAGLAAAQAERDDMRNRLAQHKKAGSNHLLVAGNRLAQRQVALEEQQQAAKKAAGHAENQRALGSAKTLELGQVLRGVANLQQRVRTKKGIAAAAPPADAAAGGGGGEGERGGGPGGSGGGEEKEWSPAERRAEEERKQAVEALAEVCEVMVDYGEIVSEWASWEEKRLAERREKEAADHEMYGDGDLDAILSHRK